MLSQYLIKSTPLDRTCTESEDSAFSVGPQPTRVAPQKTPRFTIMTAYQSGPKKEKASLGDANRI